MGIFEWVKSQTGVWGPALMELYTRNAPWINTLVLAYGLLLVLSWQNLSRILDDLVDQVLEQARRRAAGTSKVGGKAKAVRLSDFQLSWERAFAASRFPFVARQTAFLVHRSTLENIHRLIPERDLFQRCARGLKRMGFVLEAG
jgi:uncharacterized protein YdhG (YjbR/CyaY superfamily)